MNNYFIETTDEYDASLKQIISNLSLLSPNILNDFYQSLLSKFELLKIFPRMYPKCKSEKEIRKMLVKKYIVLYKIEDNIIYIINIIHQKSKNSNNQDKFKS